MHHGCIIEYKPKSVLGVLIHTKNNYSNFWVMFIRVNFTNHFFNIKCHVPPSLVITYSWHDDQFRLMMNSVDHTNRMDGVFFKWKHKNTKLKENDIIWLKCCSPLRGFKLLGRNSSTHASIEKSSQIWITLRQEIQQLTGEGNLCVLERDQFE